MKLKYLSGLCLLLVFSFIYYRYNPGIYGFFPDCPFHRFTGLDCPGCGAQRAVHALLHGRFLQALDYNALLVLSLPFLFVHFSLKLLGHFRRRDMNWKVWYSPAAPKVVLVLVLFFWIARNIPVSPFTYFAS